MKWKFFNCKDNLVCMCVSWSVISNSLWPHGLHSLSGSLRFSRQDYWSGLPFLSPGVLPNPGIKPESPALQVDSLPPELPENIITHLRSQNIYRTMDTSQNKFLIKKKRYKNHLTISESKCRLINHKAMVRCWLWPWKQVKTPRYDENTWRFRTTEKQVQ